MDIRDAVRQFITQNFYLGDGASLTDETSLVEAGVVDSTGVLEVVSFLEETFGIRVEDADLVPENLDSIGRIARYVAHKQAASAERVLSPG